MSRCFPYPPPTYDWAAEIEATKLQKERKKKERKREKKREKKASRMGENLEMSQYSNHSGKKRKHEDTRLVDLETKKAASDLVEQVEKSSLSEEHELPSFIYTTHDSPESSQDSSKRRKVILSASPKQTKSGHILRIKLPLVKQKHPVPPSAMMVKPQVAGQSPFKQLGPEPSMVRRTMRKSRAAQQQDIMLRRCNSPGMQKVVSTWPPVEGMQRVDSQPSAPVISRCAWPTAKVMKKEDLQSSANVITERVDPLLPLPSKVNRRVDQLLPSKVNGRVDAQRPAKVMKKGEDAVRLSWQDVEQPVLFQKPKSELIVNKQQQCDVKEQPSVSGRNAEAPSAPSVQVVQHSSSDRKSHKAEKKERKFRDLFVTWNPSLVQMEHSDLGDQDWLFCNTTRQSDSNPSNSKVRDGQLLSQSADQLFILQPRAIHLQDFQIYQLPYVVPF